MHPFRRAVRHRPVARRSAREEARLAAELARTQAYIDARAYLRHLR